LPTLIEGLAVKGITILHRRLSKTDIAELTVEFDLLIDCTGKNGPIAPFPISEEVENPPKPLRVCSAGFFHGLLPDEGNKLGFNIVPGLGELFEMSIMTRHGLVRSLLLEAVPGSELDIIKGDKGPVIFAEKMKEALEKFFPEIYKRVQAENFRLVDDMAYTRMAIKPVIRVPYTTMNNTLILGCGDSFALNDPITGQGANTASYCAEQLINLLIENSDANWDTNVGVKYWSRIKEYVISVSEWTNGMMGPLSKSFAEMLEKASSDQTVADEFVNMFHDPLKAHQVFYKVPAVH
jgi:hypothetical protein